MAFLDIHDDILSNGDIFFTSSRHFKAYNLLAFDFPESPEIGLDISYFLQMGLKDQMIHQLIIEYLVHFKANPVDYTIHFKQELGKLVFHIAYTREV